MGLGKILAIARQDVVHPGHPGIPSVRTGTLDTDWIPIVGSVGLAVITRDKRIRRKPVEVAALKAASLRVFCITVKRDLNNWETLKLVVGRWDKLEEIVKDRGPGPWFQAITEAGVSELSLK